MKHQKKILKRALFLILGLFVTFFLTILVIIFIYKEKIAGKIIKSIEQDYSVSASFDKIRISVTENWPDISFQLQNVTFTNENKNLKKLPIFKAQIVSFSFNALKLLKKQMIINEISVMNGNINLEKDYSGNTNFEFKNDNKSSDSGNTSFLKIKRINIKNVRLDFFNRKKNKHIGLVFKANSVHLNWLNKDILGNLSGEIFVNELMFKKEKGVFLKNKTLGANFNFIYLKKYKNIFISKTSTALIDNQKYNLNAAIYLDTTKQIILKINADIKDFDKGVTLLTSKMQRNLALIHIKNSIKIDAFIIAKFNKEQNPVLKILFSGNNNNLTIGNTKVPYKDVSFTAELLCLVDSSNVPNMKKAKLIIKDIRGKIYDFPFKANVNIVNLVEPYLFIEGNLKVKAQDIKFKPGKDFDLTGFCYADVQYKGPATKLNTTTFLKPPMKLNAQITFDNFQYKTKKHKLPFTLKGKAEVINDSVRFSNISLITTGGNFKIKGKAIGFTSYACNLSDGFKADVIAKSSMFNITPLIQRSDGEKKSYKNVTSQIKNSSFEFNILLQVQKLMIRNLEAINAIAEMHYVKNVITLKKLNFISCSGTLSAKGKLSNYSEATVNIELNNMDLRLLFSQCENFGQKIINSENVLGTVSAKANINVNFTDQFKLQGESLKADISAILKDGHLINFESLQKISNYVFRKRNFKDITFSEINPNFKIKGNVLKIENMEIATNVLNFFVGGKYNFKGQSNLNFVLPWNNLKSRGKNYITQKHAGDTSSKGLKLNVYGYPGKLKVRLGNKKDTLLVE